jgi:hypothetical protein
LFDFKNKKWKKNLIRWGIFVLVAIALSQAMLSVIKLSPFAHIIAQKNSIFVVGYFELLKNPFQFFIGNIQGLGSWIVTYMSTLLILLFVAAVNFRKYPKEKLLMFVYFILPFIALAFYGRVIFPRFMFFMMLSLIPIISIGFVELIDRLDNYFKKRMLKSTQAIAALTILLFTLYPIKVSLDFIFNPTQANIASADVEQYIKGWPSGGGVSESIDFFRERAENNKIIIATEGTFGLMPYSYEIFLSNNPNIEIKGFWPISDFPQELLEGNEEKEIFFVFYQPCKECEFPGDAPDSWPLELVKRIEKNNNIYLSIYEVKK